MQIMAECLSLVRSTYVGRKGGEEGQPLFFNG